MPGYADQIAKDAALRHLLTYLIDQSEGTTPSAQELSEAYDDAAQRLAAILDTPVANAEQRLLAELNAPDPVQDHPGLLKLQFEPDDMCVVVVAPAGVLGKGMPRELFMGPNDNVPTETLSPFVKAVVGAMLDTAREQLYG